MGEIVGRTIAVAVFASLCFCIGWVVGADEVLVQCRASGSIDFMGAELRCGYFEVKP